MPVDGGRVGVKNRRQAFVTEYLKDFDAQAAAIRCGYSRRSAHVTGYRLLSDARIGAEIAKAAEKARTSSIMTLAEAQEIATAIGRDPEASKRDRLAALDRLAKFNAWDAASKLDVTSGGVPLVTEIVFSHSSGDDGGG